VIRVTFVILLVVAAKLLLRLIRYELVLLIRSRFGDQRTATLADMLQSLVRYVVVFIVILSSLSIIGVPTAHLLAGLGIGGFALALGAQNLVRDMISGVSILMENIMAVGDYVIINSSAVRGVVIEMGARVVKLRGDEDELHQIAYSSIANVTNLSAKIPKAEK